VGHSWILAWVFVQIFFHNLWQFLIVEYCQLIEISKIQSQEFRAVLKSVSDGVVSSRYSVLKPFNKTAKRIINKNWRVYEDLSVEKEPEDQDPDASG
jgi:hypothetical protein